MNTDKMWNAITIETTVNAPIEKVWNTWTNTEHVIQWNTPSDDWHTPRAENNLVKWWKFLYRMEAKDWSSWFDFSWVYDDVKIDKLISYKMDDGRKVKVTFEPKKDQTRIIEIFDPEDINPIEMQREWWQSILDNFKKYTESLK